MGSSLGAAGLPGCSTFQRDELGLVELRRGFAEFKVGHRQLTAVLAVVIPAAKHHKGTSKVPEVADGQPTIRV